MKHHLLLSLTACLVISAGQAARAESLTVDSLACNSMDITPILTTETLTVSSWSLKGIVIDQSDAGGPDASQHCVGVRLTQGDRTTVRGYCATMYPDGDQTVIEVSRDREESGTWRLIDGTGKYAGATGEGTYEFITQARPVQEGTWQYCNRVAGSVTLEE